ncbi:MAG: dihydrodipicolinate synthase family protein [Bacteroidetes bacterium]|nr:dihydrodipicolinate synthase family protein [Bacteroidota bacterium]
MTPTWMGVYPALLTPFREDDTLDLPLFEKNLHAQLVAGVHGAIIGGSLGEASTLREDEKEELVRVAKNVAGGRIPIILNIAESATQPAIEQVKRAKLWGVDGLMLLPPMRYKSDDRETIQYFRSIAQSTALPIMIYNNPIDYKIDFRPDLFDSLLDLPNVQALKESSRDVTNLTRMINRFGDRFKILCGVDTLAMEELCLGAHGWVAGLVDAFPRETVQLYKWVQAGELEKARQLYRWFMPLLELDIHPKLVQYIKLAATYTGIGSEFVRAPRLMLEEAERGSVETIIEDALKNRPTLNT